MELGDLAKNLVSVLRYLAAPVVAVLIVLAFDKDHDAAKKVIEAGHWESAPPFWLVIGLLAALRITTYSAHRIIPHFFLSLALNRAALCVRFKRCGVKAKKVINRIDTARWRRRHSQKHSFAYAVQIELDRANAAVHFFYCTAWASSLLVLFFDIAWPNALTLVGGFWCVVIALIVIALIGDIQLTVFDIKAYFGRPSLKA